MRPAIRIVLLACAVSLAARSASATWSIVAVERSTGRVVIASATCVDQGEDFLKGVQAVIVPGKGVAACQASVDGSHQNQMLVFRELEKGTDPAQIIALLSQDPAFQTRQFGIVDLQGRSAGHSGLSDGYVAEDMQGQVPGTDIFYSIQGNILRPGQVVPNAVQAFVKTAGTLTDRVMAAMEAADGSGGDSRCNCPPWPTDGTKPPIACDGKTAHVAYMLMAEKTDTSGDSHNNGQYSMYLTVTQPGPNKGPNQIHEGENLNPVKTLRIRYDAWKKTQASSSARAKRGARVAASPAAPVIAPPPPAAPPVARGDAGPGRAGQPPAGGRGGGRGRGTAQLMTLTSAAFADGAAIPLEFTQAGEDVSPPLAWGNVPDGVTSFVVLAHDVDAVTAGSTDDLLQWMVWNIPAATRELPARIAAGNPLPDGSRQISATGPEYRGPGAPASGPAHHYAFEVYALDTAVMVPATAGPSEARAAVLQAMAGHVRGRAVLWGLFKRPE